MAVKNGRVSRSLTYDEKALKARQDAIAASPALFRIATDLEIRRMRPLILKDMKLRPRHSKSERFVWSRDPKANQRAWAWWFMNYVRYHEGENGGVYKRTGFTEKNTKIVGNANKTGGDISIEVPERAGRFVFNIGGRQIPSHGLSGHPRIDVVIAKWSPIAANRLGVAWETVADPVGQIKRRIGGR